MTLGKRIAENRKKLGLTQDQLAERLGLTAQAVSKWENDQSCPDIAMLPKLAEIFGITTDELLGREVPPKVHQAEVVDEDNDGAGYVEVHDDEDGWVFKWDGGKKSGILFAVMVLLVGTLTFLSKIYSWDVSFWSIAWACTLLCFGISGLGRKFSVFHLGLTAFSVYSLVSNLGFWKLDIAGELIFPICVVLFGLSLLIDALKKPRKSQFHVYRNGRQEGEQFHSDCTTTDSRFDCDVSFGNENYVVATDVLKGGSADISFGHLTVDLQNCRSIAPNCAIEGDCAFGELRFLIPKRYQVNPKTDTTFASVSTEGTPDSDPIATISLDADVSFGKIVICYV